MTAPTVPVTVRLDDFGGPAHAGVTVTAKPSDIDYSSDGAFIGTDQVSAVTDANGVAVLNVFPNAVGTGLGTRGTTIKFSASIPGSKSLKANAAIPNAACNLIDYIVDDEPNGMGGSEAAALTAQQARDQAITAAASTDADVLATAADRSQTGLDRVATGQDRVATGQDRVQTGLDRVATAGDRTAVSADRLLTEAARDSVNTTGKVFADTATGIAGTTNGQTFAVLDAGLQFWVVYKNNAGVAAEVARSYTKAYLDSIVVRTNYKGWLYVVTDLAGKLGFGLTTAGKFVLGVGGDIVARITSNETEIAAQKAQFARSVRGSAYAWMVLDAAKTKIALAVDKAGNLISKGRDVLAEVDAAKALAALLGGALKADGNPHTSRMAWVDGAGKSPLKATRAGRILVWDRDVLKELDALNAAAVGLSVPSAARENPAYLVTSFTDGVSKRQIQTIRKSDGKTVAVTSVGNNISPSLTSDNKVLLVSDASGAWVQSYVPADGGAVYPTFATSDLACWGDSLTAGAGSSNAATKSYPAQLSALLGGRSFFNGGIGGQNSQQIAVRQGGATTLLTVDSNLIPAAGAVAVTAKSVNILTNSGSFSGTQSGTLAGIAGTISTDAAGNWTFTRAAAGVAVACAAGTPFIPDLAVQKRGSTALIMVGRNDSMATTPDAHLAVIAGMVSYLTPYYKNFLIGLVLNSTAEGIGSANYNSIKARNDAVKAAYPNNYFDTQSPPTVAEMAALGFVPDATDNADIANGCIPTHMRNYAGADPLHLGDPGYALWALRANTVIQAKGW